MKNMIKDSGKFLLLVLIYSVVFMFINAILPFSDGFKELEASSNPLSLIFLSSVVLGLVLQSVI